MSRVFKSALTVPNPMNARHAYEVIPHARWATRAYYNALFPRFGETPWNGSEDLSRYFLATTTAPDFRNQYTWLIHGPLFYQYGTGTAYTHRLGFQSMSYALQAPVGLAPRVEEDGDGHRHWNFTEAPEGSLLYAEISKTAVERENVAVLFTTVLIDTDDDQTIYQLARGIIPQSAMSIGVSDGYLKLRGRRSSESLAEAIGPAIETVTGRIFIVAEIEYSDGSMRLYIDDMETPAATGTLNSTGNADFGDGNAHICIGNLPNGTNQARAQIGLCGFSTKIWDQQFKEAVRDWALSL